MAKVCIVVPLYNEQKKVYETISALKRIRNIDAIIAVDDGSTDGTWDILKNIDGIKCLRHVRNMGKAKALRDGVKCFDADIYLFADGDLGHTAENLEVLINEVASGTCDMSVAKFPEGIGMGGMGVLKRFSKFIVKYMTGVDFPCPLSGQRALKSELLNDSRIKMYFRFGIEVGMLIDALKSGYKVECVEIDLSHDYTKNDIYGIIHRLRQLFDVAVVSICCLLRW